MKRAYGLLFSVVFLLLAATSAFAAGEATRLAYVPSEGDNNLTVVDLMTEKVIKTLPTGKTPHVLAFTKGGKCYVEQQGHEGTHDNRC